jgi:hypothetical protein
MRSHSTQTGVLRGGTGRSNSGLYKISDRENHVSKCPRNPRNHPPSHHWPNKACNFPATRYNSVHMFKYPTATQAGHCADSARRSVYPLFDNSKSDAPDDLRCVKKRYHVSQTLWGSFGHLFLPGREPALRSRQGAQNPEGALCAPCILVAKFCRNSDQTATTSYQTKELVVQNPEGEYCATNHQLRGQGAQNPVGGFRAPCSLVWSAPCFVSQDE